MDKLLQQPLMVATILQKYYEDHYDPGDFPQGVTNAKILEDLISYVEKLEKALSSIETIVHSV
jgi:hypothetical protein